MAKKSSTNKVSTKEKNNKELERLKNTINKRYEDIEHNFYLIGLDLIKVNLIVDNFRNFCKMNLTIDSSTAYTLMRLVKRDQELSSSSKYKSIKPKLNLTKLIRLLKYPSDFVDKLDFKKGWEVPGGAKQNLMEMSSDMFTEALKVEYQNLSDQGTNGKGNESKGLPVDKLVIAKALEKLDKFLRELESLSTVLAEIKVKKNNKKDITTTIDELDSINSQASNICSIVAKMSSSLKKQVKQVKAA